MDYQEPDPDAHRRIPPNLMYLIPDRSGYVFDEGRLPSVEPKVSREELSKRLKSKFSRDPK